MSVAFYLGMVLYIKLLKYSIFARFVTWHVSFIGVAILGREGGGGKGGSGEGREEGTEEGRKGGMEGRRIEDD